MRAALHANAKASPEQRFHALYDKQVLGGWANYFCLGPISAAYRKINSHVRFDEREVETGHGEASEAPASERAGHG